MTLHLRTLGQIHLRDDAGVELRSLLTQPKRLALLVYLAATCGEGRMCRRDSLMAMFWPESDDERKRFAAAERRRARRLEVLRVEGQIGP